MDHIWDTFYTGQKRMARFPTALATGQDYRLEFAGTPPKKIRFGLEARTGGTMIHIPYPVAGSVRIKIDGKTIDPTPWDEEFSAPAALTKTKGCGENRFVGVANYLEFWLEPGCDLIVEPKDSIMTRIRMSWTLAEFYAESLLRQRSSKMKWRKLLQLMSMATRSQLSRSLQTRRLSLTRLLRSSLPFRPTWSRRPAMATLTLVPLF
jgi:hypothetical protein